MLTGTDSVLKILQHTESKFIQVRPSKVYLTLILSYTINVMNILRMLTYCYFNIIFHLHQRFPSKLRIKMLVSFLTCLMFAVCETYIIRLGVITELIFNYNEDSHYAKFPSRLPFPIL